MDFGFWNSSLESRVSSLESRVKEKQNLHKSGCKGVGKGKDAQVPRKKGRDLDFGFRGNAKMAETKPKENERENAGKWRKRKVCWMLGMVHVILCTVLY